MAQDKLAPVRLVVIGGSAGSLEVILRMVATLPITMQASVVIVVHRKQSAEPVLERLLAARAALPVREVEDKEPLLPGTIYVAPANYHLLLENEHQLSLDTSEKIHHSRPSIDITFESAAAVFGAATLAILLSGANADGAAGLRTIKEKGGITLVQDPETAEVDYMPRQALLLGAASKVVPAGLLPETLRSFLQ